MRFDIGVSFRIALPEEHGDPIVPNRIIDTIMHWAIVIKTNSPTGTSHRIIEILPNVQRQAIELVYAPSNEVDSQPVATYTGDLEDFEYVLRHHPMRNTKYSPCFNNCQHFVATYLVFLQALATNHLNRSLCPTPRYQELINSVLEGQDEFLWHKLNIVLGAEQLMSIPLFGGLGGAAYLASGATVTMTTPASGILGWLGCTVSSTAPAWYAGMASVAAPLCATASCAAYVYWRLVAKRDTQFVDPRIRGFPSANRPPVIVRQLGINNDQLNGSSAPDTVSSSSLNRLFIGAPIVF